MSENTSKVTISQYVLTAAGLVIVIAGLQAARPIIAPLLLACFFAVILTPIMRWIERRGIPTGAALLIVITGTFLIGTGVIYVIGSSLVSFSGNIQTYQRVMTERKSECVDWLEEQGIRFDEGPDTDKEDTAPTEATETTVATEPDPETEEAALPPFDPKWAVQSARLLLKELSGLLGNGVIILVTVILMLLEASHFPAKMHAVVGRWKTTPEHIQTIILNIRRYMMIKTATSLLTGVMVVVLLWLLGIPYPMLWGLLAFLLNYVPNIGSILAGIPPVMLALVTHDMTTGISTALGMIGVNCFISYAVEPRFMGQGLGLSTLVVFVSLVFWGWVLGPVGMLLSAPLTMATKIVFANYEDTRWLAILLGSRPPQETAG